MRKYVILALLTSGLLVSAIAADNGFKYLKPSYFDQMMKLTIAGKSRTYFVLTEYSQVSVTVEGPSQLKVMSRLELKSANETPNYTLEVSIDDGKKPRLVRHTSKLSEKADMSDGSEGYLGVLRSKVLDIPSGKHEVVIKLPKGSKDRVLVRLSQKTNEFTGRTSVVPMTPFEYTSAVDLVTNETIYTYYRVGGEDRVALHLVGPATLKVLSRIEFGPEMKGSQRWRLQLIEDGKLKKTYSLAASTSDVIQYKLPSKFVPSRAETFFVEVPAGEHVYEFRLPDDRRTSLLRFLLPSKELTGDGQE